MTNLINIVFDSTDVKDYKEIIGLFNAPDVHEYVAGGLLVKTGLDAAAIRQRISEFLGTATAVILPVSNTDLEAGYFDAVTRAWLMGAFPHVRILNVAA